MVKLIQITSPSPLFNSWLLKFGGIVPLHLSNFVGEPLLEDFGA